MDLRTKILRTVFVDLAWLTMVGVFVHDRWMPSMYTSAVLRLECSIDCISGSVGHQQNILRSFSHCQRFF